MIDKHTLFESWFYFRLPDTDTVWGCRDALFMFGLTPGGFAVYPFLNPSQSSPLTLVPSPGNPLTKGLLPPADLSPKYDNTVDHDTTSRLSHSRGVEEIVKSLEGEGKTVLARRIRMDGNVDLCSTFLSLCEAYPSAFVFLFSSLFSGTWIGASPELLLSIEGDKLKTMSLAGTRPTGTRGEWDEKNVEEQALVTRFITSILEKHNLPVTVSAPATRVAGPVEHICTEIYATGALRLMENCATPLYNLLTDLSPTPAVCGSDRMKSMFMINSLEDFDRTYYGGFVGPYMLQLPDGQDLTKLFVNLRSAYIDRRGATLFTGSGITPLSNPDDEWKETANKAQTLISHLKFIEYQ